MPAIVPILVVLVSGGASLLVLVFLLAASPNSTPRQMRTLARLMWAVVLFAVAGVGGAIAAMVCGRHGLGAGIGAVPLAWCGVLVALAFRRR